jgi:hypothetical protein
MENTIKIISERIQNHNNDILYYKERLILESNYGILTNFDKIKDIVFEIQKLRIRVSELETILSIIK